MTCGPRAARPSRRRIAPARGFTYLGLLFLVALLGLVAATAGTTWGFASQRDRERDLLFVGGEFRRAIESYAKAHAGAPQPYPTTLEALLGSSDRQPVVRYLRRLYADPVTGESDWGTVRTPQGGIVGVYSRSESAPIRIAGVTVGAPLGFGSARTYRDWVFTPLRELPKAESVGAPVPSRDVPQGGDQDDKGAPPPQWPGGQPPVANGNDP